MKRMKRWMLVLSCIIVMMATMTAALEPGAADMRVGRPTDDGFLTGTGSYAEVYYSAPWAGESLSAADVSLVNGQITYCIEPDVYLIGAENNQASGKLGSKDLIRQLTTDRITEAGKVYEMLGQILSICGPDISIGPDICKQPPQAAKYLAAQLIVWQLVYGDLDEGFNLVGDTWKKKGLEAMPYWLQAPVGGRSVKSWYDEWICLLQNSKKIPSFAGGVKEESPLYRMEDDTLILTDENQVLGFMKITSSEDRVQIKVEENQLIITNADRLDFTLTFHNTICDNAKETVPVLAKDITSSPGTAIHRQTTIFESMTPLTISTEGYLSVKGAVVEESSRPEESSVLEESDMSSEISEQKESEVQKESVEPTNEVSYENVPTGDHKIWKTYAIMVFCLGLVLIVLWSIKMQIGKEK